ncbi:type II toxin-antitoxin system RatA family toxin [Paracraurococcus lichenis]|uniref:Type II toxin-antitoxin system RatA family toxin n=1 Tax=Paracraurococcus lichenis TaxID=3064888 RepID=A0ABT9DX45_9PROT|nr:type II toxin-antitoxin system RatA family toxin [Paracraurococcus sp. LOR1-02]MDO9708473.1 type II toxin-antitoxin system RatA family toxin [Paracraurococcus sp. LOR1-02]
MPTHAEKRLLRYTPEQLFDMVADVRRYPEFLPWCVGARVISRKEHELIADLTIGFKMFRETFRSQVLLERPDHVHVKYLNGPFRYLNNHWRFHPRQHGSETWTEVDFFVDFEFRSRLLQAVIGTVFNEAVRLMVRAFERRAMQLYGRPTAAPPAAAPAPQA